MTWYNPPRNIYNTKFLSGTSGCLGPEMEQIQEANPGREDVGGCIPPTSLLLVL